MYLIQIWRHQRVQFPLYCKVLPQYSSRSSRWQSSDSMSVYESSNLSPTGGLHLPIPTFSPSQIAAIFKLQKVSSLIIASLPTLRWLVRSSELIQSCILSFDVRLGIVAIARRAAEECHSSLQHFPQLSIKLLQNEHACIQDCELELIKTKEKQDCLTCNAHSCLHFATTRRSLIVIVFLLTSRCSLAVQDSVS